MWLKIPALLVQGKNKQNPDGSAFHNNLSLLPENLSLYCRHSLKQQQMKMTSFAHALTSLQSSIHACERVLFTLPSLSTPSHFHSLCRALCISMYTHSSHVKLYVMFCVPNIVMRWGRAIWTGDGSFKVRQSMVASFGQQSAAPKSKRVRESECEERVWCNVIKPEYIWNSWLKSEIGPNKNGLVIDTGDGEGENKRTGFQVLTNIQTKTDSRGIASQDAIIIPVVTRASQGTLWFN